MGLVATICLASPAGAGDVQLHIVGLRNTEGDVRVAICGETEFLKPRCGVGRVAAASEDPIVVRDVPPGQYAVQVYHDENANGRLDRSSFGRPVEGLGFSRDARMLFGPPRFSDAVIDVPPGGGRLSITMRYF